jgi:enoyl-CoA hydratase
MNRLACLSNSLAAAKCSGAEEKPVTITYEGDDQEIGVISMSYSSNMNALNEVMRAGLTKAVKDLEKDSKIKVICLRSTLPKVFCAGANIKDLLTLSHERILNEDIFREVYLALNSCRKPIIAAVNKLALGGGFEIALLCDIIICSEDAQIGLPEIKLGLMPGIGGTLVAKLAGKSNAMKMILSGESINAKRAFELGIVAEVHKPEELHTKQIELAKSISRHSLYSLAVAKSTVKFAYENPGPQAFDYERMLFNGLLNLPGAREGLPAFVNKKKPDYRGK